MNRLHDLFLAVTGVNAPHAPGTIQEAVTYMEWKLRKKTYADRYRRCTATYTKSNTPSERPKYLSQETQKYEEECIKKV